MYGVDNHSEIFYKGRKWRRRLIFPLSVLGVLILVLLLSGTLSLMKGDQGSSPPPNTVGDNLILNTSSSQTQLEESSSAPTASKKQEASLATEKEDKTNKEQENISEEKPVEESSKEPKPSSEGDSFEGSTGVGDSYFDDALFIGNSLTEGLRLYAGLNATYYSSTGLTAGGALEKPVAETENGCMTIPEALKQEHFGKIYIMLGINELGWPNTNAFVEDYTELVKDIKQTQPNAVIYLQAILPVTEEKSNSDEVFTMDRINQFNGMIKQIAKDQNVCYLNVGECMSDSHGYLQSEASTDGIHLSKEYCLKWVDYLKTHTQRKG